MVKQSRNTKQKELIKNELDSINTFFSAEELHSRVKKKDETIGIATIYRYINELKGKGEVFSYVCDRRNIYSKGQKSHCHFMCEKTGKIIHFEINNLDFLKNKIPGSIKSFQLEVKGICRECQE
ncbi:hypothetical protein COV13_03430 [Candidatus Woesearchaeota archaeon CG10_big_fil_rev_8_21_14_0_10_32_9]|nr:MAG: hypothetical protein COV13_03430 [Candidatus Woesearchaeota archaeon CG10_big_fil_rev_8_21_14_0_10_32_9]